MISEKEMLYTSTTTKLLHNLDRLTEIQQGMIRPISVQLAPTDRCNLNCVFCSVKKRKMNELTIEDATDVLKTMRDMGAKTVEITGGGDPTQYLHINELIYNAVSIGLRVGLITNGIDLNKKIDNEILSFLTWVRVSLNSLDYVKDIKVSVPDHVTLGFSYVWNDLSNEAMLDKVAAYAREYKARYVRVVPDCLDVTRIEKYREMVRGMVNQYPGFFLQEKKYTVPHRCWIGYIKPFINSDGYIYHCSANPLLNRQFDDRFRICNIKDAEIAWKNPKPFLTGNCQEGKCFFAEHNNLIEQVMLNVEHGDFV